MKILSLLCLVTAQVFNFDKTNAIPSNNSLHLVYTFYAYSNDDSPVQGEIERPFIRFHELKSSSADYDSLQVSVIKESDFTDNFDQNRFCCSGRDVNEGTCEKTGRLFMGKGKKGKLPISTVMGSTPYNGKIHINETGSYLLIVSNCGPKNGDGIIMEGSVTVRNPYGYLSAIDYHKMPFYGWLTVFYLVFFIIWGVLALRWWKDLLRLQLCILGVMFLSLFESFLWWTFFNRWNTDGDRSDVMFSVALFLSVLKNIFSYMCVLVASLGWGVTRPYLDATTVRRIQIVSSLYLVLVVIRDVTQTFRYSHFMSVSFIMLVEVPVAVLNAGIFYWVFTSLHNLMDTLKDRNQTDKLALFKKLSYVLTITLVVATLVLINEMYILSQAADNLWMSRWFYTDGLQHVLFLFVTISMAYLWAPHQNSRAYSYSYQLNEDGEVVDSMDPETFDEDDEDQDSFWANTMRNKESEEITELKEDCETGPRE